MMNGFRVYCSIRWLNVYNHGKWFFLYSLTKIHGFGHAKLITIGG